MADAADLKSDATDSQLSSIVRRTLETGERCPPLSVQVAVSPSAWLSNWLSNRELCAKRDISVPIVRHLPQHR